MSSDRRIDSLESRIAARDFGQGICRHYYGRVYNGGSIPTTGDKYVLTRPLAMFSSESEGIVYSPTVDSSISVPVIILGNSPSVGDDIMADLIDGRWMAERRSVSGGGGSGTISLPGCFCVNTPKSLALTCTYGDGEDIHTYGSAYQNCTMGYYTTDSPPSYIPSSAFSGNGFYSTTAWVDDFGYIDYFRLSCFSTQWNLAIGQYAGGLWQSPGTIYSWTMGGKNPVNFCPPMTGISSGLQLLSGSTQSGIYFNGKFTAIG